MLSDTETAAAHGERLSLVRRYISEHMDERLDRAVLARVAGFSIPHLQRLFESHLGEDMGRYVRRVRLERAARKLRMGAVDITEVALAAGYETHAAFTRAFKQRYGMSPRDFRELTCWTASEMLRRDNER